MRRIRIVSFRMTEEEYECFRQHSFQYGATSVSEFARLLAGTALSTPEPHTEGGMATVLNSLKYQMETIESRLNTLSAVVERLQKSATGSGFHQDRHPEGWENGKQPLSQDAENLGN
jgi:hypothetical protein